MKCSILLVLPLCLVIISSCSGTKKKGQDDMLQSLVGRDISYVDSLFDFHGKESSRILLICSIYDCGSCLNSAFAELKILDGFLDPLSVQVVGVLSDPTPLQTRFDYYGYIAFDADDVIRRRLKYIPTPVFVVMDENERVRFLHRPTADDTPKSVAKLLKEQVF